MTPQAASDDDIEPRLRKLEHEFAERSFIVEECSALRERVLNLERQIQPLLTLSSQLISLSTQLGDLRTELAAFKGRAFGVVAAVTFIAPLIASSMTAVFVRFLKP
jgi:hypothetical protein